jgi:hypothetical protein
MICEVWRVPGRREFLSLERGMEVLDIAMVLLDAPLAQNLLHRLSFSEFIDELVQVADFFHQRVLDFFDANTTHDALDQRAIGMKSRRLGKEGLEIVLPGQLSLQSRLAIARQPADDAVDFFLFSIFPFRFLNIVRIDARKRCRENPMFGQSHSSGPSKRDTQAASARSEGLAGQRGDGRSSSMAKTICRRTE